MFKDSNKKNSPAAINQSGRRILVLEPRSWNLSDKYTENFKISAPPIKADDANKVVDSNLSSQSRKSSENNNSKPLEKKVFPVIVYNNYMINVTITKNTDNTPKVIREEILDEAEKFFWNDKFFEKMLQNADVSLLGQDVLKDTKCLLVEKIQVEQNPKASYKLVIIPVDSLGRGISIPGKSAVMNMELKPEAMSLLNQMKNKSSEDLKKMKYTLATEQENILQNNFIQLSLSLVDKPQKISKPGSSSLPEKVQQTSTPVSILKKNRM